MLHEIGEYLAMQDVPFKPRAYEKAALTIGELDGDVAAAYKAGGVKALREIPGVGASIAEKIEEFMTTGRVKELVALKKKKRPWTFPSFPVWKDWGQNQSKSYTRNLA